MPALNESIKYYHQILMIFYVSFFSLWSYIIEIKFMIINSQKLHQTLYFFTATNSYKILKHSKMHEFGADLYCETILFPMLSCIWYYNISWLSSSLSHTRWWLKADLMLGNIKPALGLLYMCVEGHVASLWLWLSISTSTAGFNYNYRSW